MGGSETLETAFDEKDPGASSTRREDLGETVLLL